ncbi:MAG: hypothetical protein AVDCRST_MAG68-5228, partial [uncultured Gemmatimonadetes bacterium]
ERRGAHRGTGAQKGGPGGERVRAGRAHARPAARGGRGGADPRGRGHAPPRAHRGGGGAGHAPPPAPLRGGAVLARGGHSVRRAALDAAGRRVRELRARRADRAGRRARSLPVRAPPLPPRRRPRIARRRARRRDRPPLAGDRSGERAGGHPAAAPRRPLRPPHPLPGVDRHGRRADDAADGGVPGEPGLGPRPARPLAHAERRRSLPRRHLRQLPGLPGRGHGVAELPRAGVARAGRGPHRHLPLRRPRRRVPPIRAGCPRHPAGRRRGALAPLPRLERRHRRRLARAPHHALPRDPSQGLRGGPLHRRGGPGGVRRPRAPPHGPVRPRPHPARRPGPPGRARPRPPGARRPPGPLRPAHRPRRPRPRRPGPGRRHRPARRPRRPGRGARLLRGSLERRRPDV